MSKRLSAVCALLTALLPVHSLAQTIQGSNDVIRLEPRETDTIRLGNSVDITKETRIATKSATSATLRGLDKMSGESVDLVLDRGASLEFGYLKINLQDCRYPKDNPTGNAFAHLTILSENTNRPVFDGWMIAASPALVALDHPRYDVWVIRCTPDQQTLAVVAGESSPRPLMRP
ncbi:MAG: DUF2155 domain-containing protein [Litoreibacter sp.]